jgi:hypothetical protein
MASIRLTAANVDALIADWASSDNNRQDVLSFRASSLSPENVRDVAWSAGVIVSVQHGEGDIYRVSFVELICERP